MCLTKSKIRGFDPAAVHVNHSLRDAADSDMEYVVKTAENLGIGCKCLKADVSGYAEKNGISFETAGREIRYKFSPKRRENYENALIATAHNANDSAESFFYASSARQRLKRTLRHCGGERKYNTSAD